MGFLVKIFLVGAFSALAFSAPQAVAQTRSIPTSHAEVQLSFAPLVKRVAPAVVNIFTRTIVQERRVSPLFNDPFFRQFFGDRLPGGGTREREESSLGSGVIVDASGIIVTNRHVIEGADEIRVVLNDRREFEAEILQEDERSDLAVLKINTNEVTIPTAILAPEDTIEVGDLVIAIGNPFGVGQTVTSGIVSALARSRRGLTDFGVFIQTDAAINPGNSGGALVDMQGRIVGVNTAIYSKSGGSLGIGFAIPSSLVARMVEAAKNGGRIVRPWLGAHGQEVTAEIGEAIGLSPPRGVLIDSLSEGGSLMNAGLRQGDVVLAVDGRPIGDPLELRFRVSTKPIGSTAEFDFWRAGKILQTKVRLEAPPEDPPRNITVIQEGSPIDGAEVANLSPAVKEEFNLSVQGGGVVVLRVLNRGFARRLGLRQGDVIMAVNGRDITRVKDLIISAKGRPRAWEITILRGGRRISLQVG
jgi:Do/DeqQ family serine protease